MVHNYELGGKDIRVGIVGGRGYAGLELASLLRKHPRARLRACFSAHSDFTFADYLPGRAPKEIPVISLDELDNWTHELNTVFLATPVETSIPLAAKLLEAGVNVIDLSGAFRLNEGSEEARKTSYSRWYGMEHDRLDLLDRAEYGLMPWVGLYSANQEILENTPRLVANPGCYATSVLLAILPLLKRGLIKPESLVIDAKSGTSGAGRKPSENLLFTEVEGECLPYRIGRHQHLPEICQFARFFSGATIEPIFTTHLLNVRRGIISGIYARLQDGVTEAELTKAYAADYSNYGLVEWGSLDSLSGRAAAYRLSLKRVVGTGMTGIYYQVLGDKLHLFSLIDNLIKGAAGQAVENFNRIQGLSPETGVKGLEGVL